MEEHDWSAETQLNTFGVTLNADIEPKTHHQTQVTCTYGYSHFKSCSRDGNTTYKYIKYCFHLCCQVLEVLFSVLKKGASQYFVHIM